MAFSFQGKVAVVTGGGAGLGAALVRELVRQGALAVQAVDLRFVEDTDLRFVEEAGPRVEQHHVDVTDSAAMEQFLAEVRQRFGRLDVVVNNAGVSVDGEPLEIAPAEWERVVRVNLLGVIYGSLAALRVMAVPGAAQVQGLILNLGSMTGLALTPLLGPYSASKAGVVTFSRGLAEEARGLGVQVSVACPGNIATSILPEHVSGLMKPMRAEVAARRILEEAAAGRRIIVFPLYARVWWLLERVSPALLGPLRQVIVRRSRARAAARAAARGSKQLSAPGA